MVEKCPAKYKNLNYIQSFSEQGYATIQLMQQACMNDEWLRQRVLKLNYLSPPAVRKWYGKSFQNWVDNTISYGYKFDKNGNIIFGNTISKRITVDFVDDEYKIDFDKTDASIVTIDGNSTSVVDDVFDDEETDTSTLKTIYQYLESHYDSDGSIVSLDSNGEVTGVTEDSVESIESNILHCCQLPFENEASKYTYTSDSITQKAQNPVVNLTTRTIKKDQGCNAAWYVGFNKSKKYYVRPDWLKSPNGWKDKEIPSVARGQTFKATVTGYLESIDLKLNYSGVQNSDCGSPLYVQIWQTKKKKRPKTVWNNTTKKMEYVYKKNKNKKGDYNLVDGKYKQVKKGTGDYTKIYEKVYFPDTKKTGIYKPLTQAKYDPSKMKEFDLVNIKFKKQVKLDKGKTYFIALFSPLSEYKHCPSWGGWGRNCAKDKKYQYGYAFLSEDNGRTWMRYGRSDANVKYRQGRYVPQDFAFQCHIRTKDKKDEIHQTKVVVEQDQIDDAGPGNPRYLYLKPIFDNPITHVRITADAIGTNATDWSSKGIAVRFDYKAAGMSDWVQNVTLEQTYALSPDSKGNYPHVLFVRARLYRDITTMSGGKQKFYKATPRINSMTVEINTQLPKEMYVRTEEYLPPMGDKMLGASIWGRLYSVFDADPTVTCTAEIVTNEKPTDHFRIIEVEDVKEYAELKELDESIVTALSGIMEANGSINESLCTYLYAHQEIIEKLKMKNVYIKPYTVGGYTYLMSFKPESATDMKIVTTSYKDNALGGISFSNNVAYPIRECVLTSDNSSTIPTSYSEWHDYTFDYDKNILTFKKDVLDSLPAGDIAVTYNKVFISGLTKDEVGVRKDPKTGLREEGLILDYFKQTYIIDSSHIESKRVKLRVEPVDPIREVVLNRDTEKELELYEGYDYEVNIDTQELEFKVNSADGKSTVLSIGDVLEVVYTPNLNATGVSVGYYAKRENTDKNVRIGASYWEYKV